MSRLITTSPLDSIDWCRKAPDSLNPAGISWKQDAYEQLKRTVGRAPWVPNASLERGTTFENQIYGILKAGTEDTVQCTPKFREILYACKGGQFQRKTKSFLTIDGQEYLLYGKLDIYFPDRIKDIKTTGKYGGKDKYLSTSQHHIYCFGENIKDFTYIIAEFPKPESYEISSVNYVEYSSPSRDFEEAYVRAKITDAVEWLSSFDEPGDLGDLYLHTYCKPW